MRATISHLGTETSSSRASGSRKAASCSPSRYGGESPPRGRTHGSPPGRRARTRGPRRRSPRRRSRCRTRASSSRRRRDAGASRTRCHGRGPPFPAALHPEDGRRRQDAVVRPGLEANEGEQAVGVHRLSPRAGHSERRSGRVAPRDGQYGLRPRSAEKGDDVDWYLPLKLVHVLSAIVAVGTNLTYFVWLAAMKERPRPNRRSRWRRSRSSIRASRTPAYAVPPLTGVIMVLIATDWGSPRSGSRSRSGSTSWSA